VLTLAFDTATDHATSALVDDGEVLGERTSRAVTLLEDVDALLRQGGAHPRDLGSLVVGHRVDWHRFRGRVGAEVRGGHGVDRQNDLAARRHDGATGVFFFVNVNITLERDYAAAIAPIELVPQDITRVCLNLIGNGFYAATKRQKERRRLEL